VLSPDNQAGEEAHRNTQSDASGHRLNQPRLQVPTDRACAAGQSSGLRLLLGYRQCARHRSRLSPPGPDRLRSATLKGHYSGDDPWHRLTAAEATADRAAVFPALAGRRSRQTSAVHSESVLSNRLSEAIGRDLQRRAVAPS
jgi:hypothetical protein